VQLAAKPPDFGLLAEAQQGSQSQFNRLALGFEASCLESLLHELIVDHNVGSQLMCILYCDYTHAGSPPVPEAAKRK
jgi:hypothetical protein